MQLLPAIVIVEIFHIVTTNPIEKSNLEPQSDIHQREHILENLEKEKNELYIKINKAINDTVKALQMKNDTESLQELEKIKELKRHFEAINKTDNKINLEETEESFETQKNNSEVRRAFDIKQKKLEEGMTQLIKQMKKQVKTKETKTIDPVFQKQLDDWIAERKARKEKEKEYREKKKKLKLEKCPRHGLVNRHKKYDRKTVKYPCCRKCCKSSYMGCL